MKVQTVDNNIKYNQNNLTFKAYITPNANFHILYGHEASRGVGSGINPKLVKQLNELPNHCIEILKLNRLKDVFTKVRDGKESILDKTECTILNQTTKQTAYITLEDNFSPLNQLLANIIGLKDKKFFKHKATGLETELYNTLTTGKPLDKLYADLIK